LFRDRVGKCLWKTDTRIPLRCSITGLKEDIVWKTFSRDYL